jgi:hypothetical protein
LMSRKVNSSARKVLKRPRDIDIKVTHTKSRSEKRGHSQQ